MMLHKLLSNRFHHAFIAILLIAIGSVFFADIAQAQVSGELGTSYDELVLAGQQPGDKSREILSNLLSDFSANPFTTRSDERRVGNEGVCKCRSRWWRYH